MRFVVFTSLFFTLFFSVDAQDKTPERKLLEFRKLVQRQTIYPDIAKRNNTHGMALIYFKWEKAKGISDFQINYATDSVFAHEVINTLDKRIDQNRIALTDGIYVLPINFEVVGNLPSEGSFNPKRIFNNFNYSSITYIPAVTIIAYHSSSISCPIGPIENKEEVKKKQLQDIKKRLLPVANDALRALPPRIQ